tara:strand:+ start:775 stop:2727 length:1953 start_codon:yes stop_codon:yes gene_type:complete
MDNRVRSLIPFEEIEEKAQEQVCEALKHNFLSVLAIMPDIHMGYSLPIGAVALLENVISPAYVGYDIGCFTGDTKVSLCNGDSKSLKELANANKDIEVWAFDNKTKKIIAAKAISKLTKKDAQLIRITLDNDEEIICTPDHEFLLRDGTYKQAQKLSNKDSLMPYYSRYNKTTIGKEQKAKTGTNNIKKYMENNPEHFADVIKENAERGADFLSEYNKSEKASLVSKKVANANYTCDICNEEVSTSIGLHKKKFHGISKVTKEYCFKDAYRFFSINNKPPVTRDFYRKNRYVSYRTVGKLFGSWSNFLNECAFDQYNHKINSIEKVEYTEDVYCLVVPDYNNFALEAGVFVHNCGMCCTVTDTPISSIKGREKEIFDRIYELIPVGFNSRETYTSNLRFNSASRDKDLDEKVNNKLNAQLGTLGSGNHFIEIGYNREDKLTVTVHSGSRNIGHSIASYYMKQNDDQHPEGFLSIFSEVGKSYHIDMVYALNYALANRRVMLQKVLELLVPNATYSMSNYMINENHNHAEILKDYGIIHRKGATPANKGQLGVIPGNMRDGVYITRGLGNHEFLSSASHGAGRVFSRKKAKQLLELEDFKESMEGITALVQNSTIDESPFVYKDINKVIGYQEGKVVDVIDHITPVINIKG